MNTIKIASALREKDLRKLSKKKHRKSFYLVYNESIPTLLIPTSVQVERPVQLYCLLYMDSKPDKHMKKDLETYISSNLANGTSRSSKDFLRGLCESFHGIPQEGFPWSAHLSPQAHLLISPGPTAEETLKHLEKKLGQTMDFSYERAMVAQAPILKDYENVMIKEIVNGGKHVVCNHDGQHKTFTVERMRPLEDDLANFMLVIMSNVPGGLYVEFHNYGYSYEDIKGYIGVSVNEAHDR